MLDMNNQYQKMKFRIESEVLKHLFDGTLVEQADRIPIDLIPRDRVPSRCCIYKEREVVRYRMMALAGFEIEKHDDEYRSLSSYMAEALEEDKPQLPLLTGISIGCSSCPSSHYMVSDACRGCFARPCSTNCPKDAIVFINGKAHIQTDKCIKCGKCKERCPYHSIVHNCVPCEDVCPVDAIKQNEAGISVIDHDKCIGCGKCKMSCPFGAVAKRSGLLPVAKMLKNNEKMVAIIAPAVEGQFPGSIEKIKAACLAAGFDKVMEVAEGARLTAENEAKELMERKEKGEGFLCTSCCPAWVAFVEIHAPQLMDHVSKTLSPMGYTAIMAKEKYPDHKVVFIGPCVAKRYEANKKYPGVVDRVLSFSELHALLDAKGIDMTDLPDLTTVNEDCSAFEDCRNFAVNSGVAGCVMSRVDDPAKYKVMAISGLDKKTVRQIKLWTKLPPDADLIEVMACEGGCIAGPGSLVNTQTALKSRAAFQKERDSKKEEN